MYDGEERRESSGYIIAKLESIAELLAAQDKRHELLVISVSELTKEAHDLRSEVERYVAQWKAIRWFGGVLIALFILVKSGDASSLKEMFSAL